MCWNPFLWSISIILCRTIKENSTAKTEKRMKINRNLLTLLRKRHKYYLNDYHADLLKFNNNHSFIPCTVNVYIPNFFRKRQFFINFEISRESRFQWSSHMMKKLIPHYSIHKIQFIYRTIKKHFTFHWILEFKVCNGKLEMFFFF